MIILVNNLEPIYSTEVLYSAGAILDIFNFNNLGYSYDINHLPGWKQWIFFSQMACT